jgi:hypothetical protein
VLEAVLVALLLLACAGSAASPPATVTSATAAGPQAANLLQNGSFEHGGATTWYEPWGFAAQGVAQGRLSDETDQPGDGAVAARIEVTAAAPSTPWDVQLYQGNLPVTAGTPVTVHFLARASALRSIGLALNGTNYQLPSIALSTDWQPVSYTFTPAVTTTAALTFNFGQDTGVVWLDAVAFGPATNVPGPAAVAPPAGPGIYLGVTQHPAPWDMRVLDQFERDTGRPVAIVSYFVDFAAGTAPERAWLTAIEARGAVPLITWEWTQTNLAGILTGAYDHDAQIWAWALRDHGGPVLLRWGHEMNGPWYPWSVDGNGNTAQQYIEAWRRLRGIFQREGATNVQWVWSPNIIDGSAPDFAPMYPGDADVDWVALDGYNWATRNPWQSFTQIFQPSYDRITALTNKPLMIAEWGSTEQGGEKGAWLRSALTSEIPSRFPRIKAVVYFNQDYREDWRITSSEAARRGYADGITGPQYRDAWP